MQESGQEKTRVVNLAKKREGLAETVGELLAFNDERGLWLILNRPHGADLGRCCAQLDDSHRRRIFPLLADELAADVLAELDTLTMFDVAEDLAEGDLSGLVEAMEPDDAADLLGELRTEELERVLGLIPVQEAEPIREVLSHDEDTGGGIMNSRLLTVGEGGNVAAVIAYLRQWRDDEQLFYLYVLDACIGVAMLAAILFSAALGLLVPLFFRSIGLDPAVASGLLITTLSDVFSLAIYFAIAIISLHVLF